jgi:hypothetical protein
MPAAVKAAPKSTPERMHLGDNVSMAVRSSSAIDIVMLMLVWIRRWMRQRNDLKNKANEIGVREVALSGSFPLSSTVDCVIEVAR